MRFRLVLCLLLSSFEANAECELGSKSFYTIAKPATNEQVKNKKYLYYYLVDPFWYFKKINNESTESSSVELRRDQLVDVLYDNKICSKSSKVDIKDKFVRIPACNHVVSSGEAQYRGFAVFESNKIFIPRHYSADAFINNLEFEKRVSKVIETYFQKDTFGIGLDKILDRKKLRLKSIESLHLNSNFSTSRVEVENGDKGTFLVVLLIAKDQVWLIADTLRLSKCNMAKDPVRNQNLSKALINEGWDFNGDLIPDLIRFNESGIYYHIEYGKEMLVIKDFPIGLVANPSKD
jgi:hypothetical protein